MKRWIPEGWHAFTPRLIAEAPAALVRFLKDPFAATGELQAGRPAEMRIGDSIIMVSGTFEGRRPTETFLYLYVEDADATYARSLR